MGRDGSVGLISRLLSMFQVLFVSPERFLNADFLSIFSSTTSVSLVVVDEVHCISEW